MAASRALPVAAEVARERLASAVAQELAEGRPSAFASRGALASGAPRVVEAAETVSADGREALAVVVAEDEAVRSAADALLLLSVAVALAAVGLGGRAALTLGGPLEELIAATANVGEGRPLPPLVRPANVDLARLVDAFTEMSARVEERTESLAEERASAVGLLGNLTAAVLLFRRGDGTVLLANPAADRLLPGGTLPERLADERWAPLHAALGEAAVRPSPYEMRVTIPAPTGERFFRVAIVTLPGEERAPRVILLLEDLTDFLRADRLAAWVDAARSIAHDIKNPLTPIRLAAERLGRFEAKRETPPPGAIGDVAAGILRQVGILTDRIGRLGRFGDPAAVERRVLDRAAVALLLEEVAADFRTHETLAIETETDPDLHPFAADPFLVRDALTNFLVNAVEAIGAAPGHVRLSAGNATLAAGAPAVRFACADDGPGVPEDVAGRLFEPTFSTKSRGSGMGLAAVRRAAERHAGSVFAHPRAGGGLVVGFTLPALSSTTVTHPASCRRGALAAGRTAVRSSRRNPRRLAPPRAGLVPEDPNGARARHVARRPARRRPLSRGSPGVRAGRRRRRARVDADRAPLRARRDALPQRRRQALAAASLASQAAARADRSRGGRRGGKPRWPRGGDGRGVGALSRSDPRERQELGSGGRRSFPPLAVARVGEGSRRGARRGPPGSRRPGLRHASASRRSRKSGSRSPVRRARRSFWRSDGGRSSEARS